MFFFQDPTFNSVIPTTINGSTVLATLAVALPPPRRQKAETVNGCSRPEGGEWPPLDPEKPAADVGRRKSSLKAGVFFGINGMSGKN